MTCRRLPSTRFNAMFNCPDFTFTLTYRTSKLASPLHICFPVVEKNDEKHASTRELHLAVTGLPSRNRSI